MHIDGVLHTVIGVMPKRFELPVDMGRPEVWVPIDRSTLTELGKGFYGAYFTPILRLNAGIHPEAVEAQLTNVHVRFPTSGEQTQVHLVRLHDLLVRHTRPALFALEIYGIASEYMELAVRTELPPDAMIGELRPAIVLANPHLAILGRWVLRHWCW